MSIVKFRSAMINKLFGKVLAQLRHERGLTQQQLASRTNIQRGYISLLERGAKSPSLTTLFNLAIALDISLSDLIMRVDAAYQEAKAIPVSIYALSDPQTQAVHYIGKSRNPKQRFNGHLTEARTNPVSEKCLWIAGLLAKQTKPLLIILEETNEAESSQREAYWIVQMMKQNQPIMNQSVDWKEIRAQGFDAKANMLQLSLFDAMAAALTASAGTSS